MKYIIIFLGTDGSGKSTIINKTTPLIEDLFKLQVKYEHMRPNYIPSLGEIIGGHSENKIKPTTNPHGKQPSNFIGSLFRLSYYMIDYTWGYFRKVYGSQAVWIFDRYFYDYIIDPLRGRLSLPKWIINVYGWFIPNPDIIICLGGKPETIYERKPETSLEEVSRQICALQKFCNAHPRAVWIDTSTDINNSILATMCAIKKIQNTK